MEIYKANSHNKIFAINYQVKIYIINNRMEISSISLIMEITRINSHMVRLMETLQMFRISIHPKHLMLI